MGGVYVDQVLSICTGIGGLDLGLQTGLDSLGRDARTVCYVEREAFSVGCLVEAIKERRLDDAPIWLGDLRELPIDQVPCVSWITAGYPCQPFSVAGSRKGKDDPRHLWPCIRDIVERTRPTGVLLENVSGHVSMGLFDVLSDLEELGFRTAWGLYRAEQVGAPHRRERVFILGLADTDHPRRIEQRRTSATPQGHETPERHGLLPNPNSYRGEAKHRFPVAPDQEQPEHEPPRTIKPGLGRDAHGVSSRVDRLRALGNAVVPQQAEMAFLDLWDQLA